MATGYQGGNDVVVSNLFQPLIGMMQQNRQLQIKQAQENKKEAFRLSEETQKELAKVNRNGIREVDLEDFNKLYNDAKDLYFTMNQSSDPNTQRMLRMQINNKLGEAGALADKSRKIQQSAIGAINGASSLVGKGKPEDYVNHIKGFGSKKAFDIPDDFIDKTPFMNKYDSAKVDSTLKRLGTGLLNSKDSIVSQTDIVDSYSTTGGKLMNRVGNSSVVRDEVILESLSNEYRKDPNLKAYVDDYMTQTGVTDLNQALAQIGEEAKGTYFSKYAESSVTANKPQRAVTNITVNMPNEVAQVSRQPLTIGKFKSDNSITRNDKGVLLSGNKVFYDPQTGNRLPVGRDQFSVDFTQDVELPIDKDGKPLTEGDPKAVGTQNFSVGQVVDPSQPSLVANTSQASDYYKRTVLIPEGDRQLFGKSKTVKSDAVERSKSSSSTRNSGNNSVSSQQTYKAQTNASSR